MDGQTEKPYQDRALRAFEHADGNRNRYFNRMIETLDLLSWILSLNNPPLYCCLFAGKLFHQERLRYFFLVNEECFVSFSVLMLLIFCVLN